MPATSTTNVVQKLHRLHSQIEARGRLDTRDALQAGALLLEQKAEHRRAFVKWVADNEADLGFGYRTAARYMRLYRAKCDSAVTFEDMPLYDAYVAAGIIRETPEPEEGERSRGKGEVVPTFQPVDGLQFVRRSCSVPCSVVLSPDNFRNQILALLADERALERALKAGGLALVLK